MSSDETRGLGHTALLEKLNEVHELSEEEKRDVAAAVKEKQGGSQSALFDEEAVNETNLQAQIQDMKLPEKIKLAMLGNSGCRAILIRDPNKMIRDFVLGNPKLTLKEVEEFSRNTNLDEGVLRTISGNKTWMKNYKMKLNLVMNPKTPIDLSVKWLKHILVGDLRRIARSKNLPSTVVNVARKRLAQQR